MTARSAGIALRRFRRKPATSPGRPPRWAVRARPFVGPRAQGAAGSGKGFRCPRRPPSCFVGPGVRQEPHGRRWGRGGNSAPAATVGGRRRAAVECLGAFAGPGGCWAKRSASDPLAVTKPPPGPALTSISPRISQDGSVDRLQPARMGPLGTGRRHAATAVLVRPTALGRRRRAGDGGGGPATATAGRVIQTWTHQPTRTYRRVRYSQRVDTSRSGSIRPRPNSSWGETRRVTAASICAPLHTRCARPLTLARARGPSVGSLPGSVGLIRLGQPPSPS